MVQGAEENLKNALDEKSVFEGWYRFHSEKTATKKTDGPELCWRDEVVGETK